MVSRDIAKDGLSNSKVYACGICGLRVRQTQLSVYIVVNTFTVFKMVCFQEM